MYSENKSSIQARRNIFEKHKVITYIIYSIYKEAEKEIENNVNDNAENDDEFMEEESTSAEDIEKFERWIKAQAHTSLRNNKDLTNLVEMKDLRNIIIIMMMLMIMLKMMMNSWRKHISRRYRKV